MQNLNDIIQGARKKPIGERVLYILEWSTFLSVIYLGYLFHIAPARKNLVISTAILS